MLNMPHNIHRGDSMGSSSRYDVNITWDDEADVWIAISSDEVGLALEHDSLDALLKRVHLALPEMLELNNLPRSNASIRFAVSREDRLMAHG